VGIVKRVERWRREKGEGREGKGEKVGGTMRGFIHPGKRN